MWSRAVMTLVVVCSAAWAAEPLVDQVRARRALLDAMPLMWIVPRDYVDTTIARTQPGNGARVAVRVSDMRTERATLGESIRRERVRPFATRDSVALWFELSLDTILTRFGMCAVDSGYDWRIECRLNELSVRETNTYDGALFMEAILFDSAGVQAVHRLIKTQVRRWGPTYNARDVNEAITSLLIDWYREFWVDPEIAGRLRARPR